MRRRKRLDPLPQILIFDVDGVLIDVKETFWRSALQTVEKLTGKKTTAGLYFISDVILAFAFEPVLRVLVAISRRIAILAPFDAEGAPA